MTFLTVATTILALLDEPIRIGLRPHVTAPNHRPKCPGGDQAVDLGPAHQIASSLRTTLDGLGLAGLVAQQPAMIYFNQMDLLHKYGDLRIAPSPGCDFSWNWDPS